MDWISLRVCRSNGMPGLALLLCFSAQLLRADPPEKQEIRVARLIRQLGAADCSRRQQADEQLARLGPSTRAPLEEAVSDEDLEVRLRVKRLLDRIKLEDLWSAATVQVQVRGEPASKILASLAAQSGNRIHVGDPYGNFSEAKLNLNYSALNYWQAVDDVCAKTGNRIRPHYDMHTPGVVVSAGAPGNFPRAYGGPVRAQIVGATRVFIEALNYEEQKAELTHSFQISLQFMWEDRFHIVGYAAQPELVEAVTDNKIVISSAQPTGGGWNATSRGLRQVTASLKLNPVPVSAKAFEVFKIKWGLIAVGEPATLDIPRIEPEKQYCQDDLAVKIEAIEKQPAAKYIVSLSVLRDLAMPDPQEVVFQEYEADLTDGQGRAFRLQSQTHALTDHGVQLKLAFSGESADSEPKSLKLHYPRLRARRSADSEPKSLKLHYPRLRARRDVELVFRDVPLPVGKPE
ncbi:MAG: hypothetical protein HY288_14910 [Planctomycetia bacterium]|nr:hypothetical protein [Planctomycetia bacterium]